MANQKVVITMENGVQMHLELYADAAPVTVQNFVNLVQSGFYDGLCFHRVIDGFMIQGGGYAHTARGLVPKEGVRPIKGEFVQNGVKTPLKHTAGTISMARTNDPNSAGSQFFICVADTPFLDGAYAAFGRVVDKASLDTAVAIGKVATGSMGYFDDVPRAPVVIKSIRLEA